MGRIPAWLRAVLAIALWIAACLVLRPLVDKVMSADGRPFFNDLIAGVLATVVVVAAGMFSRPTTARIVVRVLAIVLLLALTLTLAWCSAVSHWGGA